MTGYQLDQLQQKAATIANENANLRAENRRLRTLAETRTDGGRIIRQAERDALTMLEMRWSGTLPTRRNCAAVGIPARRWQWAIALLRAAGVYGVSGHYRLRTRTIPTYDVVDRLTLDNAQAMVSGRATVLCERANGLEVLRKYNGRYR